MDDNQDNKNTNTIPSSLDEQLRDVSFLNDLRISKEHGIVNPIEKTRGVITHLLIKTYCLCIFFIILALIINALYNPQTALDVMRFAVDLLNNLMLPVITLALGYYFGTEKSK